MRCFRGTGVLRLCLDEGFTEGVGGFVVADGGGATAAQVHMPAIVIAEEAVNARGSIELAFAFGLRRSDFCRASLNRFCRFRDVFFLKSQCALRDHSSLQRRLFYAILARLHS